MWLLAGFLFTLDSLMASCVSLDRSGDATIYPSGCQHCCRSPSKKCWFAGSRSWNEPVERTAGEDSPSGGSAASKD